MLPDFPTQKTKLSEFWDYYGQIKMREYSGVVGEVRSYRNYEGAHWRIEREDGSSSETDYAAAEAGFSLHMNEVPNLTPDIVAEKINQIASEMGSQVERSFWQTVFSVAKITNEDGLFTKERFLAGLESIAISFDKSGTPSELILCITPQIWKSIKDDVASWEQDTEFNKRYAQIIERKREEWNARESSRKLVD